MPSARGWPRGLPFVLLLGWAIGTAALSWRFASAPTRPDEPVLWFVALQIGGGVAWLATLRALRRAAGRRRDLLVLLGFGLLLRLPFFVSAPILEDDAYRYLWDGAVLAHGLDPYAHAPTDLLEGRGPVAAPWRDLVEEGGEVLARVNHPDLKTIYPPVAQGAFAVAHRILPWKLAGLRVVWLFLDLAAFGLLAFGLGAAADRTGRLAILWLNPLFLKEVYNGLHMEPVLLVFLVAALLLAARRRVVLASIALGLAIGAKLWPVLWLPLFLRAKGVGRRTVFLAVLALGAIATLSLWPLLRRVGETGSGLGAFARGWEMNDSVFILVQAGARWGLGILGSGIEGSGITASLVARGVVGGLVLLLVLRLSWRPWETANEVWGRALAIVAALFLLGPTGFPWYSLWLLPPLVLFPLKSLLLLTLTLPLYYLRFRFMDWGMTDLFDYGVVWLEFVPVWILLVLEVRRGTKDGRVPFTALAEGP